MSIKKKKQGSRAVGQSRRTLNYQGVPKHPKLVMPARHVSDATAKAVRKFMEGKESK